jgi:hypothetical protein
MLKNLQHDQLKIFLKMDTKFLILLCPKMEIQKKRIKILIFNLQKKKIQKL